MRMRPERVLGVFVAADAIFLVELERPVETGDAGRLCVRQAREEPWRGSAAPWENAAALSGEVMRLCMTYGLSYDKISVCLPRELCFVYERAFPPMGQRAMAEAAHWDMEANVPFAEESYWMGFGHHGDKLELAALPSEYGHDLMQAMAEAGLGIEGLTMEPLRFHHRREGTRILWRGATIEVSAPAPKETWVEGLTMALYAALRMYFPRVGVEFLPEEEKAATARLWQAVGNAVLACAIFVMVTLLAGNLWALSVADEKLDALRQEHSLESRERETMERILAGKREIADGENSLRRLSAERLSWYAVFSVLGAAALDGVHLTEFDVQEDGALLCRGHAADYARLAAYVGRLGQEASMFRENPLLLESAADERGGIKFKIRLRFSAAPAGK